MMAVEGLATVFSLEDEHARHHFTAYLPAHHEESGLDLEMPFFIVTGH